MAEHGLAVHLYVLGQLDPAGGRREEIGEPCLAIDERKGTEISAITSDINETLIVYRASHEAINFVCYPILHSRAFVRIRTRSE